MECRFRQVSGVLGRLLKELLGGSERVAGGLSDLCRFTGPNEQGWSRAQSFQIGETSVVIGRSFIIPCLFATEAMRCKHMVEHAPFVGTAVGTMEQRTRGCRTAYLHMSSQDPHSRPSTTDGRRSPQTLLAFINLNPALFSPFFQLPLSPPD